MNEQQRLSRMPRLSKLPTCSTCSGDLVAPEASVLDRDGQVSYVWSCDRCGQSLVTSTAKAA